MKDQHELMLERADSAWVKRLKDKQKRWGKPHDDEAELIERAEVARLNSASLVQLMGQYNFLIPARSFPLWRPTQPSKGDIDGIREALELVATDGILGWFITFEGEAWLGHIKHFSGDVKPLHSVSFHGKMSAKPRTRKKSKRQQLIDSL